MTKKRTCPICGAVGFRTIAREEFVDDVQHECTDCHAPAPTNGILVVVESPWGSIYGIANGQFLISNNTKPPTIKCHKCFHRWLDNLKTSK